MVAVQRAMNAAQSQEEAQVVVECALRHTCDTGWVGGTEMRSESLGPVLSSETLMILHSFMATGGNGKVASVDIGQ